MTVRTEKRRGERRLIIDIIYKDKDGRRARYRHDAQVQTLPAARAEDQRRMMLLVTTGSPFDGESKHEEQSSVREVSPKHSGTTVSLATATKTFLELYGETRLKPSTRRGYKCVIDSFLVKEIGHLDLTEIDATVVRELDKKLAQKKARPSTRRNVQCVLRAVRRFSIEQGLADELPPMPPLPRVGATAKLGMSDEELDRVEKAADPAYELAFALGRYAGLRAGEVRGLRWTDVDLARNVIVVRRSRCHGVEAPPKSGHERMVPIHPILRAKLEAARERSAKGYVTGPKVGEPWSEFSLGHAFSRACKAAGVKGFHLHDLRHWFVTTLFRSGNSAPVVQRLAGHEHLITTQRYAHATFDELEEGIRRMSRGNSVATSSPEGSGK